jgi:chromosome segregation ATPase
MMYNVGGAPRPFFAVASAVGWLLLLSLLSALGAAAAAAAAAPETTEDSGGPDAWLRDCEVECEILRRKIRACDEKAAGNTHDKSLGASESSAVNAANEKIRDAIKTTEAALRDVEQRNAELHRELVEKLRELRTSAVLGEVPFARELPDSHRGPMSLMRSHSDPVNSSAIDAWHLCEDEKTALQLQLDECAAGLIADETNRKIDEIHQEQLGERAEASTEMLKQRQKLLEEQLRLAKERLQRLEKQVADVRNMAAQGGVTSTFLHLTARSLDSSFKPLANKSALRRARDARDRAAAAHREALEAADQSRTSLEAVEADAREVREDLAQQNTSLREAVDKASESKDAVKKAQAEIEKLRAEAEELGNKSHDAFFEGLRARAQA